MIKKYKCDWPKCGYEFEQDVNTSNGDKHSTVTDTVVCRGCGNLLKS